MINAKDMKVSVSTAFFGRSAPDVVHFYAEAGIDALVSLMRGFVTLGGFFMQLDVADASVLKEAEMLPASACRLLSVGVRSGSGDRVMEELAMQLSREAGNALEEKLSRIEPAIVVLCSVLVGVILLAVMLPLLHIRSAIG